MLCFLFSPLLSSLLLPPPTHHTISAPALLHGGALTSFIELQGRRGKVGPLWHCVCMSSASNSTWHAGALRGGDGHLTACPQGSVAALLLLFREMVVEKDGEGAVMWLQEGQHTNACLHPPTCTAHSVGTQQGGRHAQLVGILLPPPTA